MDEFKITVGLEIHAELATQSKMFCGCKNDPEEKEPNLNICPICMGHPGTLPVINKEAVKKVLQVSIAVGGETADFTEFDRKNYFYPDIPKDYQISQYAYPLVKGGSLAGVTLTRIHLEEDTARSSHEVKDASLVDFNRAGVPLMELVTEPVIHSAEEAMKFGRELQLLLQYLGASEANMEKGQMRVEVNISVSNNDSFGTKVEVKNINSFKAAGKAIDYEFNRQVALIKEGKKVIQETRGWDEHKEITFSQRSKENSNDYRYFPDPDLPKLHISEIKDLNRAILMGSLPETPDQKRQRYTEKYAIKPEDIEVFVANKELSAFFESVIGFMNDGDPKIVSNYVISDLFGLIKQKNTSFGDAISTIFPKTFSDLMLMVHNKLISSRGAKDILKIMLENGGEPNQIAKDKGLLVNNDIDSLRSILKEIINEQPEVVEEYKNGKISVFQFIIGQAMKKTKGSANPELLQEILGDMLK